MAWTGLLRDLVPDFNFRKRGKVDWQGAPVSAMRARQIAATGAIRNGFLMFIGGILAKWLDGQEMASATKIVVLLCVGGILFAVYALDWGRQDDMPAKWQDTPIDSDDWARIAVPAFFVLPLFVMLILGLLVAMTDLVYIDYLAGMIVDALTFSAMSLFGIVLIIAGLARYRVVSNLIRNQAKSAA